MATLSLHLAAAAQGIDDALIQPYSGHESRQSLEISSRLSLSLAEAGLRTNDAHLSCGVNLQRRHLGGLSPFHGWAKEGRRQGCCILGNKKGGGNKQNLPCV